MTSSRDDARSALPPTAAGVLAAARVLRVEADRAEADLLQLAVQWAVIHPAESVDVAETVHVRAFGDTGIPVAGPGAPLVAEFSVAELAAALGLGTEAGMRYVGHAVELHYRLERTWKRVLDGHLPAWKARRVADQTLHLSLEAAQYVDRQVAPGAHKIKPAQLDRLITEAIARFMPEKAEELRRAAWDHTHVRIDHDTVGIAGTSLVTGELDYLDALDLDDALCAEAQRLADLGNTKPPRCPPRHRTGQSRAPAPHARLPREGCKGHEGHQHRHPCADDATRPREEPPQAHHRPAPPPL